MRTILCAITIIVMFTLSVHAFAAPDNTQLLQQNLATAQEEVKQLKAQQKVIQSYQDNFLSTVYWSLGTVSTIVLILIGFSWFANLRNYERDKNALREELKNVTDNELAKLNLRLQGHVNDTNCMFQDNVQKLEQLVEKHFLDSNNMIQKAIIENKALIESRFSAMYEKIKKEIMLDVKKNLELISDTIKINEEKFNRYKNELRFDIYGIEYNLTEIKYNEWMRAKVYPNALRYINKMLDIALNKEQNFFVSRCLDNIQSLLYIMLKDDYKGTIPDGELIREMNVSLDRAKVNNALLVESIKSQLSEIRSKPGVT